MHGPLGLTGFETPVVTVGDGILMKLENFNPTGSHKARAARFMVEEAIARGDLVPGGPRRILEKTGGNLGLGLAHAAARHQIGVDLVVGLSFSPLKRAAVELYGARLIGREELRAGKTPREVVEARLAAEGGAYHYTDQFANRANLRAHLTETGPQLLRQVRDRVTASPRPAILVMGAGTGASLTGVGSTLRTAFPDLRIVAVAPEGCDYRTGAHRDHRMDGIAVGVRPPFLDLDLIDDVVEIDAGAADLARRRLARECGLLVGPSSAANFAACLRLRDQYEDNLMLSFVYDCGEAYLDRQSAEPATSAGASASAA